MKQQSFLLLAVLAVSSMHSLNAQDAKQKGLDAITEQAVQGQLEFLASDWTEGRHTGREGAYLAADYIASVFKIYGLEPGGDFDYTELTRDEWRAGKRPERFRTFYQSFELIEYKQGDKQEFSLIKESKEGKSSFNFEYETDFSVRTSDVAIELETPVVFVGYGFRDKKSGYDDFKGVDVKGKVILRLGGYPGYNDTTSTAYQKIGEQNYRSLWRAKREVASELGAAAIIEVYPDSDNSSRWVDNLPFRYDSESFEGVEPRKSFYTDRMSLPGEEISSGATQISVSKRVVNELLKGSGIDLEAIEASINETAKPASKELKGTKVRLKTTVDSRLIRARNVVGVIPGKDTSEIIVVGGHYDHLGIHDGWIWNGADDNASGTVGVMTIAKAFMATGEKPEKTMVFCAWTGEEKGLIGSRYFADHPYNDAKMKLNLNYDMISRDDKSDTLGIQCGMTYTKKYEIIEELTKRNNEEYDIGLEIRYRPQEIPRGGSDHSSFSAKDVPVMYFMAGFPPEYHQPGDHVNLVNWDKMVKIIKIGYLDLWDLANSEW